MRSFSKKTRGFQKTIVILMAAALLCGMTGAFFGCKSEVKEVQYKQKTATAADAVTVNAYTDEYGTPIEGLEAAVAGKPYWLSTAQALPVTAVEENGKLILQNGTIKRVFHLPEVGGTAFYTESVENIYIGQTLTDRILPEAVVGLYDKPYRAVYDGKSILEKPQYYYVGGKETGSAFLYRGYEVFDTCEKAFDWNPHPVYGDPAASPWEPKGKKIVFSFAADASFPGGLQGVRVDLIYEMYDNTAAIKKRVEFTNTGEGAVTVGRVMPELLGIGADKQNLVSLETSYECGDDGTIPFNSPRPCACKEEAADSPFLRFAEVLHTCYEVGPAYQLEKGERFATYDTYEFFFSTYWFANRSRERLGMYRKLFPWITDNPLIFHSTKALSKKVIDHAAAAGFEIVIQSFAAKDRSAQMLTNEQKQLDHYKELADYAKTKGIGIGIYQAQYQLKQYMKTAESGKNGLGKWGTWCLASAPFQDYYDRFVHFLEYTGVSCVEIDGPYPNCLCDNGEKHKGTADSPYGTHYGYHDSQVKQWENAVRMLMAKMRDMGVYVNVPAWYYLSGANKCGIGYEEVAFSEPRQEQLLYGRQIMHNASFARTMSMSWTHIPFSTYHGGGKDAKFKPFRKNLQDYDWVVAQTVGNGVGGVFRGDTLYDKKSLPVLQKWTNFYKQNRSVIGADIVPHIRAEYEGTARTRTTGIDTLLHAGAEASGHNAILWVYNQTDTVQYGTVQVPLYYAGLTNLDYPPVPFFGSMGKDVHRYGAYPPNYSWLPGDLPEYRIAPPKEGVSGHAAVTDANGKSVTLPIDKNGNLALDFRLEPMSYTYYLIGK